MIKYSLACNKGHGFEAWFKTSTDYDRQAKRGLVACPECGSAKVEKAMMAPRVARRGRRARDEDVPVEPPANAATLNAAASKDAARLADMQREMRALMRKVRSEVEKNAEYVGPRFAEEARKIHLAESEPRGIYGEASSSEVEELHDEGIECYPLPVLPEDQN